MTVQKPPRLKKSETLEIRLPYPTKLAFMARCRDEGHSASEAVRRFIDGEVEGVKTARVARRTDRLILGMLAAAAMGAVALPSLAHPSLRAEFDRLTHGADALTLADFQRLDTNHDGKITYAEFRAAEER
jgi:EF hand